GLLGGDNVTGVDSGTVFHAGAHYRGLGHHQRHRLTLYVRTHEGAAGDVVVEERDQGRCHGHHLTCVDVHAVDLAVLGQLLFAAALRPGHNLDLGETVIFGQGGIGMRDVEVEFVIGGQLLGLIGDDTVDDLAVGRLDEAEGVDAGVGGQRADQSDVRAFGSLDRAHAAVVRGVHVTDFHGGTVTRERAGAQWGETALVGQTRELVVLIHELTQLGGAEELLDRSHDGADVDQGLRGDRLDVLSGHALTHDALHAGQTRADLVLDELADGADAAVA